MFQLPDSYACIVPTSSQTQVYAYNARERDTYDLVGFDWVKTRHVSYNYDQDLSSYLCLDNLKVVPASIKVELILPATIVVLCFFHVIMNMIMAVRR